MLVIHYWISIAGIAIIFRLNALRVLELLLLILRILGSLFTVVLPLVICIYTNPL